MPNLYLDGGVDPSFDDVDDFLKTSFNARAMYISEGTIPAIAVKYPEIWSAGYNQGLKDGRKGPPEREALVNALINLEDIYFATGIEYGDMREMADEMIAHWGQE